MRKEPVCLGFRRYPILICFLKQSLYDFTDDLIEMVDQRLWELYNQAKRNFDSDRLLASKTIDEKLKTLQDIGQILLDGEIEDNSVRVKNLIDATTNWQLCGYYDSSYVRGISI
ncbi:MAG: hypothetical protein AAGF83_05105 [Cyanobacteria bacterium P01_G01_bin.67]